MWWLVEWEEWDPFGTDGEMQGMFIHKEKTEDKWDNVLTLFNKLITDGDCGYCEVTAMWGEKVYGDGTPVLTYCP